MLLWPALAFGLTSAEPAPPTLFDLIDDQIYILPADVPDMLLAVENPYYARDTTSLDEGNVTAAWITVPAPDGTPPAIVYRCLGGRWIGAADAWLAPLGVDLAGTPDLLPFAARVVGSLFTLDAPVSLGGSRTLPSHTEFTGVEDITLPSGNPGDLPLARIRKIRGVRAGLFEIASLDRADYVLRLGTSGGAGPGAGAPCVDGDADVRDPYEAAYWFVRLPFVSRETADAGADAGAN